MVSTPGQLSSAPFYPKLEDLATTLGEKDLQNNDLKLVSLKYNPIYLNL